LIVKFLNNQFNKLFILIGLIVIVLVALRAFCIPFSHDETATFFYYVQSNHYMPYYSHAYTNNHVFNSALTNLFYNFFGSHRFVLRLPNLLSLLILIFALYKISKTIKNVFSKLLLISLFLLTFHFLDFFEMCRGYGISMAFLVLAIYYFIEYLNEQKNKHFLFFLLCVQIALAANLTFLIVILALHLIIIIFQLYKKQFLNFKIILIHVLNCAIYIYWIKLLLFYKANNLLDSGMGEDYWQLTFVSLIEFIFGLKNLWFLTVVVFLTLLLLLFFIKLISNYKKATNVFRPIIIFPALLFSFVIFYYLLKKLFNINYPEDRTGLFFYILFVLSLVYFVEEFSHQITIVLSTSIFIGSTSYFICNYNTSVFGSYFYHTMSKNCYNYLKEIQSKQKELITIGGHRLRELNYAFLNYRGNAALNHMNDGEEMQMNCDYFYAMKHEASYYNFFYDEIFEDTWGHVLLKRKEKINHQLVFKNNNLINYNSENEFIDVFKIKDTTFNSSNPLETEVNIKFLNAPKPLNAFLVFSVNDSLEACVYYKRIPLNWLGDNLNEKTLNLKLTMGNIPKHVKSLTLHIWNIEKQRIKFEISNYKVTQLFGKGVNFKIPQKFYPLIEKVTQKYLL